MKHEWHDRLFSGNLNETFSFIILGKCIDLKFSEILLICNNLYCKLWIICKRCSLSQGIKIKCDAWTEHLVTRRGVLLISASIVLHSFSLNGEVPFKRGKTKTGPLWYKIKVIFFCSKSRHAFFFILIFLLWRHFTTRSEVWKILQYFRTPPVFWVQA